MATLGTPVLYDPGTVATKSVAAAAAMSALDTTNARITFTAPSNGSVLCRIRVANKGATGTPRLLLGILEGSTVLARCSPYTPVRGGGSTSLRVWEAVFVITGLSAGSHTFDAAVGVESAITGSLLGWGGPNNTTASDAYGALSFEVWETENLLAGKLYDPGTAATKATSALLALTALDTTNLRLTFTAPTSGKVYVQLFGGVVTGGATGGLPAIHLGVLDGATVKMRMANQGDYMEGGTIGATSWMPVQAQGLISGLTGGNSYTWDAAYAVETVLASSNLKYGGPDNTTVDDAFGGFGFYVWKA